MSRSQLPKIEIALALQGRVACDIPQSSLARWNAELKPKAEENTISILDPIGADFFGEGITAKRVSAMLEDIGHEQVTVNINSPGGDVFEGIAIYNLLRDHPRKVTVRVLGVAASAASVIAMAGDRIEVARAGFMMIHNVWVAVMGNRNDLREVADMLEPFDQALADVYATRTKSSAADMAALMDKESWFSGQQAVEQGFADALLPADQVEESEDPEAKHKAALRLAEASFKKSGMPRSQQRALLRELTGTPSAAEPAMPSAGDEVAEFIARMTRFSAQA